MDVLCGPTSRKRRKESLFSCQTAHLREGYAFQKDGFLGRLSKVSIANDTDSSKTKKGVSS